jgi:GNAT superfamily N-acetyltransferase
VSLTIRPARAGDGATLHALLLELAVFEQGSVDATAADLERDAFGPQPRFEALLAEHDGRAVGMLTYLSLYSSWRGRPALLIHDLFVREEARGLGAGKALVASLGDIARQRGCCRIDVNVLDWNDRARTFYAALGFAHNEGWLGYRLPLS